MSLKHNKVSGKSNPGDTTVVGGGHWDEDHLFKSSSAGKLLAVGSSDAIVDIGPAYGASIKRLTTAQSISSITSEAINFLSGGQVDWNIGSIWSSSTNQTRFTIPVAGIWMFEGCVAWEASTDNRRNLCFRVNGSTEWGKLTTAAMNYSFSITTTALITLAVSDYVELVAYNGAGSAQNVLIFDWCPRMQCQWLRPAS